MKKKEFYKIRRYLGKTQSQMAPLLGISTKAIQSFEQGWRKIPSHVERQALFLLSMKKRRQEKVHNCWQVKKCSLETRGGCPAWELHCGHLCWFINGTICRGGVETNWEKKMKICRKCEVFRSALPTL